MTPRRLRVAAALAILIVLLALGSAVFPVYLRNLELQSFVDELAHRAESRTQPDGVLTVQVLEKARTLDLPVKAGHVHIERPDGALQIEVRYTVPVQLLFYRVDLHFYPGAGGR